MKTSTKAAAAERPQAAAAGRRRRAASQAAAAVRQAATGRRKQAAWRTAAAAAAAGKFREMAKCRHLIGRGACVLYSGEFYMQVPSRPHEKFQRGVGRSRPTGFWAKWPVRENMENPCFRVQDVGNDVSGSKMWKNHASSYISVFSHFRGLVG